MAVKFGKSKSEQCAKEIIGFLLEHGLWQDTYIYANNRRFGDYDPVTNSYHYYYGDPEDSKDPWNECVFVEEDVDPHQYLEYAGDFLSMSFEGPLYRIINYEYSTKYCDKIIQEFDKILNKYGMYYEQGNAWNLSLYNQ